MARLNSKFADHEELIWQCDAGCADYLRLTLDKQDPEWRMLWMESAFHLRPWFRSHGRFSQAWKALRGKPDAEHYLLFDAETISELRAALKPFDIAEGGVWNYSQNGVAP